MNRGNKASRFRVLITGFGPFGEIVKNPSGRIARRIKRAGIDGAEVDARVFPVSYGAVDKILPEVLAAGKYDLALMLGVAGGEDRIRIERYARNRDSASARDNDGRRGHSKSISESGVNKLETSTDIRSLRALLKRKGIGYRISKDAGGFLCNHAYYRALDTIERRGMKTECLFVHVPPHRHAIRGAPPKKSMRLRKQFRAVRLIAEHLCVQISAGDKKS